MDIKVVGTIKKYRNQMAEWTSLLVRQGVSTFYLNIYFKKGEPEPAQNHKVHIKAIGKLFKDKRTFITRISLKDAIVLEDLGLDEVELIEEQYKEEKCANEEQTLDEIINEGDDVPWF